MYIDTDKEPENGWLVSSIPLTTLSILAKCACYFHCVSVSAYHIYIASVESRELRTLADKMLFYEGKSLRLEQQYNAKIKCYKIFEYIYKNKRENAKIIWIRLNAKYWMVMINV